MKINERIMRIMNWPIDQTERFMNWMNEGERAASNNRRTSPIERRCYLMNERHLSGYRLIVGFESLDDCQDAHDFLLRHHPQLKKPEEEK